MAKCIYTRGCTGVRLAFVAIVFVFQLLIFIKAVQLLLWQAIAFLFPFLFVSPHIDIIIAAYLFLVVFAPLVLRFSSRVFLSLFPVSAICLHDSRTRYKYYVLQSFSDFYPSTGCLLAIVWDASQNSLCCWLLRFVQQLPLFGACIGARNSFGLLATAMPAVFSPACQRL
jgi:hypothetical protein